MRLASISCLALLTMVTACGARSELRVDPPLSPPRPIAPLSTARVTNHRPTLAWMLSRNATGARVELCRDLHCETVEATLDVDGDHARPVAPLRPGTWYWRLTSRYGDVLAAEHGPVWQFHVPSLDSPVDTSWGQTLDLDLDGRSEWAVMQVVTAPVVADQPRGDVIGRIHVFRGGDPIEASSAPTFTFECARGPFLVPRPAAAGDLDGDGLPELVANIDGGGPVDAPVDGHTFLFHADALQAHTASAADQIVPVLSHPHETPSHDTLFFVVAVGDVDRDGYGDLAGGTTEAAYLFRGGPEGVTMARREVIARLDGGAMVFPWPAGDVNGDGVADFVVQSRLPVSLTSRITFYFGSPTGIHAGADLPQTSWQSGVPGSQWIMADGFGDMNGDGYSDVLFTVGSNSHGPATIVIAWGSAAGPLRSSRFALPPDPTRDHATFGYGSSGDYDGDGIDDVMVYSSEAGSTSRAAWFAPGDAGAPYASDLRWRQLSTVRGAAAHGVAPDIDGDGRADTADEFPLRYDEAQPVAVYLSGPDGPPDDPTAQVLIPQ